MILIQENACTRLALRGDMATRSRRHEPANLGIPHGNIAEKAPRSRTDGAA